MTSPPDRRAMNAVRTVSSSVPVAWSDRRVLSGSIGSAEARYASQNPRYASTTSCSAGGSVELVEDDDCLSVVVVEPASLRPPEHAAVRTAIVDMRAINHPRTLEWPKARRGPEDCP